MNAAAAGPGGFTRLSPPGLAAVTVVALAGDAGRLALADARGTRRSWPAPEQVAVARLMAGAEVLDEVVVVGRVGGGELHLHGGAGVWDVVAGHLRELGFHEEPWRGDVEPRSWRHLRALASARSGPLAALLQQARDALANGRVDVALASRVDHALGLAGFGRRLARSARVRLVGRPNAGKSTLFNALLGDRRALVSPRAGTTRDTVSAAWQLRGVPLTLEDAAGLPDPSSSGAEGADVLIHVLTEPEEPPTRQRAIGNRAPRLLAVLGKADLRAEGTAPSAVSGLTGEGLAALTDRLAVTLDLQVAPGDDIWTPLEASQTALLEAVAALGPQTG